MSDIEAAPVESPQEQMLECCGVRQEKVLATFILLVDLLLLYLLGNPDNPFAVWSKLEEQF